MLRPYLDKAALGVWEGICSTDILVLRALSTQNRLMPEFRAYPAHTRTFLEYAIATMTGVNDPRTSWKALQQLSVLLDQNGLNEQASKTVAIAWAPSLPGCGFLLSGTAAAPPRSASTSSL